MASKPQAPKQRTLEFFMGKPKTTSTTAKNSENTKSGISKGATTSKAGAQSSSSASKTNAPLKKSSDSSSPLDGRPSDLRSMSSHSRASTPPTSEFADIDMMIDEEEEAEIMRLPSRVEKRKLSILDSDEEESRPTKKVPKERESKRRGSIVISDDEDEEPSSKKKSSSKSLARPTKRRKTSERDDDFIAPSDEEEEDDDQGVVALDDESSLEEEPRKTSKLKKFSARSFISSALSVDDEDEEEEVRTTTKKKAAPRPSISAQSSSSSVTATAFKTKAEIRAMNARDEKKENEKPFEFLETVKDKDGIRPGEPGYDPRTLYIPKDAWDTFTPFEKQFWDIKQHNYDTILFFQKGKFYELYEDDARIGHQIFDLKLTHRVKMSMVGVPEMSYDFWASKFLARGFKVGKVEQAETSIGAEMRVAGKGGKADKATAKADKLVKRVLNKVYTNGTLMDAEYLLDEEASHCVSLREIEEENKFGLAILDSSTSEFKLSSFEDDECRTKLETILRQLRPKEIIMSKGNLSVSTNRLLKNVLPMSCSWTILRSVEGYTYAKTLEELTELYSVPGNGDEEERVELPDAIRDSLGSETAIEALGSLIWYLRTLNIDKTLLSAKNFNIYDPMRKGEGLVLDGQTLAHLEILVNGDGMEDGTLLKLISRCVTPFGKRLFRIWICMPLREIAKINDRLDAVEDLMRNDSFGESFVSLVKSTGDLERIVSRIHAGTCKVKDFVKVLDSFRKLSKGLGELAEKAASFETQSVSGLLRDADDLKPYIRRVREMFVPPEENATELVPEPGMDEEWDALNSEMSEIEGELESKLVKLSKKVGTKLEFWHSATGTKDIYLVQLPTPDKKLAPKEWQKHNETKAKTRFMVPEFAGLIRKLKEARESTKPVMKDFLRRLYNRFDEHREVWLRVVRITAELDCLLSLAKASDAIGQPSCRPTFIDSEEAFVEFEELRHPGIALALGSRGSRDFISNDVFMGGDKAPRIMLLTGPNMAGKSTLMRQTCVGVIMAQLGMYVPASSARISPVDAILTRMGAYDNMFSNSSTFKVELDECCKIIREATPKSLVILDELGRGTSTFDGIAIAGAALHHLATHTLALSCFATHYSSLTNDYKYHPNIRTMHMATSIDDDKRELIWLYKLVEGVAPSSFGTHVASLAGVPNTIVERANVVSDDFAKQFAERLAGRTTGRVPVTAQVDLSYLSKLVDGKLKLDENPVRSREVLKLLRTAAVSYGSSTV